MCGLGFSFGGWARICSVSMDSAIFSLFLLSCLQTARGDAHVHSSASARGTQAQSGVLLCKIRHVQAKVVSAKNHTEVQHCCWQLSHECNIANQVKHQPCMCDLAYHSLFWTPFFSTPRGKLFSCCLDMLWLSYPEEGEPSTDCCSCSGIGKRGPFALTRLHWLGPTSAKVGVQLMLVSWCRAVGHAPKIPF